MTFNLLMLIAHLRCNNYIQEHLVTNTVFYRIHAPARTPKNPDGHMYSGIIRSKSERCQEIPELAVSFLMAGKSRVHAYSIH